MATEKRGVLFDETAGCSELLVLRRGTLRIFPNSEKRRGATSGPVPVSSRIPTNIVHLAFQCQFQKLGAARDRSGSPESRFEIQTSFPHDLKLTFRASNQNEGDAWFDALERSKTEELAKNADYIEFIKQGCTAYKYNYSNSKRMRRHFWVDADRVELCWGKSRADEPQTIDLKDSVGVVYGPLTTTFVRCPVLEDPPQCCFSLLFPDRTLDLAVPSEEMTERWFLGLQHLLLTKNARLVSALSEPQFVFRKVSHKLRASAHRQGLTTRRMLISKIRGLAKDPSFRESMVSATGGRAKSSGSYPAPAYSRSGVGGGYPGGTGDLASAEDAEAAAKAERRRKRRESKAEASSAATGTPAGDAATDATQHRRKAKVPEPKAADGVNGASGVNDQAEEEELLKQIEALERDLEENTGKLEALRPAWESKLGNVLPLDSLGEVFKTTDDISWQAEKCGELEREALSLRGTNGNMDRQLASAEKAEKQLKKLAKQFKESEAIVQTLEQELAAVQAGAQNSENAKFSSSAAQERAEAQKCHLERRVKELEQQLQQEGQGQEAAAANIKEKNKKQKEELARLEKEKADLNGQLQDLAKDTKAAEKSHQENLQKLGKSEGFNQQLLGALKKLQKEVGGMQSAQKQIRGDCQTQLRSISDLFPPLNGAITKIGAEMGHLDENLVQISEERKKLHNLVLELKGNIRVFVRVRPMNEREKALEPGGEATITFAEDIKMSVYEETTARRKWFEFDKVFSPKTEQQQVFEEVKPLATSVLDGYNVCIFAYGQTGSGKTFTMTGNKENPGLNVRVLKELFRIREERKLDLEIRISMVICEIYNETIKDLFDTKHKKLEVKTEKDGSNSVPGLVEKSVESVEDVLNAMQEAQGNRTVMATDMNEESSRSHSIVQVKTTAVARKDKREYTGKINLIDLAGSENVQKSGVSGQGLKEAQNINKSLSALGDVISSLIAKSGHVPYRNSKLTMMLKDSLGGDSKTLMIVQCSPAQTNCVESLSSLNFASRARNVELGKAKRNVKEKD